MNEGWMRDVVGSVGVEYEGQSFNEALQLATSLIVRGRSVSQVIRTMIAVGVIRNDAEVAAFDAWEQRQ